LSSDLAGDSKASPKALRKKRSSRKGLKDRKRVKEEIHMNPMSDPIALAAPELWGSLLRSVGMLSIVLGLLVATLLLIRRFFYRSAGGAGKGVIRMLASCPVAPKERILLIEVLGEKLLIGVSPHAVSYLAKIAGDCAPPDAAPVRFFPRALKEAIAGRFQGSKLECSAFSVQRSGSALNPKPETRLRGRSRSTAAKARNLKPEKANSYAIELEKAESR